MNMEVLHRDRFVSGCISLYNCAVSRSISEVPDIVLCAYCAAPSGPTWIVGTPDGQSLLDQVHLCRHAVMQCPSKHGVMQGSIRCQTSYRPHGPSYPRLGAHRRTRSSTCRRWRTASSEPTTVSQHLTHGTINSPCASPTDVFPRIDCSDCLDRSSVSGHCARTVPPPCPPKLTKPQPVDTPPRAPSVPQAALSSATRWTYLT
jgi:hypothetical protein